ncbi:uncharacterized protein LOC123270418 [Cotesia glomerata]|uniref:uncharacterized protein LOC123270418 n=1 Tax=Cotesia glomerata TaxID=32391 RepID=UPI001D00F70A|nr:uncharacterized protein LOC123270418 [Cotesia glomerata]
MEPEAPELLLLGEINVNENINNNDNEVDSDDESETGPIRLYGYGWVESNETVIMVISGHLRIFLQTIFDIKVEFSVSKGVHSSRDVFIADLHGSNVGKTSPWYILSSGACCNYHISSSSRYSSSILFSFDRAKTAYIDVDRAELRNDEDAYPAAAAGDFIYNSQICLACSDEESPPDVVYNPCRHCIFCQACQRQYVQTLLGDGQILTCSYCRQEVVSVDLII